MIDLPWTAFGKAAEIRHKAAPPLKFDLPPPANDQGSSLELKRVIFVKRTKKIKRVIEKKQVIGLISKKNYSCVLSDSAASVRHVTRTLFAVLCKGFELYFHVPSLPRQRRVEAS